MRKLNQVVVGILAALVSVPALAEHHEGHGAMMDSSFMGFIALGAGIAIGLAVLGAALGQGGAAKAALEGISRNPSAAGSMFVPLILSLVFMEALGILAFLIAFFLNGNLSTALSSFMG